MFRFSTLIIRLISILFKQLRLTLTTLAMLVCLTTPSLAKQPEWVLSGTFLSAKNAHAMFVDGAGDELLLQLGDDIQGCDLVDVLQGSAKLNCSGYEYTLHLRSSVGDILLQAEFEKSLENKETVRLSKADVEDYVKERQRLVSEIGFLPLIKDDKVVGYTLSKIQPDTKAASLGLYNGDIIKSVNGISAGDEQFMEAVESLSNAPEITIQVDRYGQSMAYTYILE